MKQRLKAVLLAAALFSTMAGPASRVWAQGIASRSEISAGYTYASVDQNVGFGSGGRLNSNGWNTAFTIGARRSFGWEFNFANVRHSESGDAVAGGIGTVQAKASEQLNTFVTGPRFILDRGPARPFFHTLFGIDHESLSVSTSSSTTSDSESISDNSLAVMLGGGLVIPLSRHMGLITEGDYLLTRHGIPSDIALFAGIPSSSATQHNFRVTAGIVFRLGSGFERSR
jgi:opacity protein-like surface antigen